MDTLAETGANWFCMAAHMGAGVSFEMTTCGSPSGRFAVGLATMAVVAILCIFAAWRASEGWR